METRELYEAPSTLVVEVKQEGVICASNDQAGTQNYTWNEYDE